jgi:hypothetical protein
MLLSYNTCKDQTQEFCSPHQARSLIRIPSDTRYGILCINKRMVDLLESLIMFFGKDAWIPKHASAFNVVHTSHTAEFIHCSRAIAAPTTSISYCNSLAL